MGPSIIQPLLEQPVVVTGCVSRNISHQSEVKLPLIIHFTGHLVLNTCSVLHCTFLRSLLYHLASALQLLSACWRSAIQN
ncbi:hypothetical protein V5799_024992 [Amblyomma americanum]|uniref:Uncharacterized protein n=1 Tax=Amblyomma americanum TaxID=6943 RepID=A0AAQ4EAQ6_AMBAM